MAQIEPGPEGGATHSQNKYKFLQKYTEKYSPPSRSSKNEILLPAAGAPGCEARTVAAHTRLRISEKPHIRKS